MPTSRQPLSVGLLLIVALPLLAAPAWASESVRLRSGRTLALDEHKFEPEGLRIVQQVPGGTLGVRLAYPSIDPESLRTLFRTHGTTVEPSERIGLAALALTAGLPRISEQLFAACTEVDALREAALAGVQRSRRAVAEQTLRSITQEVASGADRHLVRQRMTALAQSPYAQSLTAAERQRLGALERLVAPRDLPAAAQAAAPPQVAAAAPPDPASLLRSRLGAAQALRERAADPGLSDRNVRTLLDRAALSLRRLRQEARTLPASVPAGVADDLARDSTDLLAATLVDLAECHRQAGRFHDARAHVRSALLFRPEHPSALQQRGLIESDLASLAASAPYYDPYYGNPHRYVWSPFGRGFETYWIGSSFGGSTFGYYRPLRGTVRGFSLGHRRHRAHSSGGRRVIGARR